MKSTTISRRYAKALLLIGEENDQTELYKAELSGISHLMAKEVLLEQAVCNPLYDAASRKRVLGAVIEKLKLSQIMSSFLLLLLEKGRIGFLSGINDCYQKFADEMKGIERASIVSATSLSPQAVEKIKNALSKKTGKNILLTHQVDAGLIGGIVTKIGDLIFDGSINTQLFNMKESLKKGEGAEWN